MGTRGVGFCVPHRLSSERQDPLTEGGFGAATLPISKSASGFPKGHRLPFISDSAISDSVSLEGSAHPPTPTAFAPPPTPTTFSPVGRKDGLG